MDAGLGASTVGMTQVQARELLVGLEVQERRMHALRLRLVRESVAHDRTVQTAEGTGDAAGEPGQPRSARSARSASGWSRTARMSSSAKPSSR